MSEAIIKVENLSKRFVIHHEAPERYTTLRDTVVKRARKIISFPSKMKSGQNNSRNEEFWALKDVNFEINQGDRVGIIGRNGAGKSTLLKILSRITEPSKGRVTIHGRSASLLEVGTGFHPELSGRENIYLNGAILGMSRADIRRKFDEIVTFAEVEKFLDTPVKRYSSGMYVRLAFAVAANLEPEILIMDEVLAVGDAQFQKKCLGKMEDVSKNEGRTILFVSHNMAAIKSLCTSAIILHKGEKILQGDVYESLARYFSFEQNNINDQARYIREKAPQDKKIYVKEVELVDDQSKDFFCLFLKIKIQSTLSGSIAINLRIKDGMGFPVAYGTTYHFLPDQYPVVEGENSLEITSVPLYLATGKYKLSIELAFPGTEFLDTVEDCLQFELSHDGVAKRDYGLMQEWGYGSTEIKFKSVEQS